MQMKFDKPFLKMVVGNCPTDHKTFIKIQQLVICGIGLNRDKLTNHMDTIDMKSRIVEEGKLNRQCCENRLEMRKTEIRSHVILKSGFQQIKEVNVKSKMKTLEKMQVESI